MDINKDYYAILGVLANCDSETIKIVYKSLIKVFHPDIFKGPKEYAHNRTAEINEAYSVLSNQGLRKEYDKARMDKKDEYKQEQSANNDFNFDSSAYTSINDEWLLACKYTPGLSDLSKMLDEISIPLGVSFKIIILEQKSFAKAHEIAFLMKDSYLEKYFGKNLKIKEFAEELIISKNKEAARELNKVINTLGSELDAIYIISSIKKEFLKIPESTCNITDSDINADQTTFRLITIGFCAAVFLIMVIKAILQ